MKKVSLENLDRDLRPLADRINKLIDWVEQYEKKEKMPEKLEMEDGSRKD